MRRFLPAIVIGLALATAGLLLVTSPTTERRASKAPAPVVEVLAIERGPYARRVEAFGTVVPAREVSISPEVAGRVVEVHPQLDPGGVIARGDTLVRIDPAEYALAVAAAEAELDGARAELELERGRQRVARREWELFGDELPETDAGQELALREPQLRQADAHRAAAASALERARLDLARTVIRAPFDCLVRVDAVEVGQRVGPGVQIAVLAGTESFWVQASLPISRLPAALAAADTPAEVLLAAGMAEGTRREGRLIRSLGQVDPEGRMAQVLVEIADPLLLDGAREQAPGQQPLPLGSYVRVELAAGTLEEAVTIPRRALRENGEIWVDDADGRLRVREADVIWSHGEELAVRDVFERGDRIIVSPLANVVPGMLLRARESADPERALSDSVNPDGREG